MRDLAETSLQFVQTLAPQRQIKLAFVLPPQLANLTLPLDERRICQALINLLNNAVCFTVTDTGIGFTPKNIHQLFESFVQIDSTLNRKYNTTDLGLALVKRLTHLHGGNVGASRTPGQGSFLTLRLPYTSLWPQQAAPPAPAEEGFTSGAPEETRADSLAALPRSPLVLLMGQGQAEVHTFASYLAAKNHRTLTAHSSAELLDLLKTITPHLLLIDTNAATPMNTRIYSSSFVLPPCHLCLLWW